MDLRDRRGNCFVPSAREFIMFPKQIIFMNFQNKDVITFRSVERSRSPVPEGDIPECRLQERDAAELCLKAEIN